MDEMVGTVEEFSNDLKREKSKKEGGGKRRM